MASTDKAQKIKESNKIRQATYRKNKETPDQAERRKNNELIRSRFASQGGVRQWLKQLYQLNYQLMKN